MCFKKDTILYYRIVELFSTVVRNVVVNFKSASDNRSGESLVITYLPILPPCLLACLFDSVLVLVVTVDNFVWIDFLRIATFIAIDVQTFKSLNTV